MASDLEAQLASLSERLTRLEQVVLGRSAVPAPSTPEPPSAAQGPIVAPSAPLPAPATRAAAAFPARGWAVPPRPEPVADPAREPGAQATVAAQAVGAGTSINVLGWAGAAAFVLAAAYLIRLAIDAGVLTPIVQIAGAVVFGLVLIGTGLAMKSADRGYAGLLPAAGVVVLFLSIYGAQLVYHLIGGQAAGIAVAVVCVAALGLSIAFDSDLYALFAILGSYGAPTLLADGRASLESLALYYSAWSVTFTAFAILRGRRLIYLVAVYAALISFDVLAHPQGAQWRLLLEFQAAQFLIYGLGAVLFSIWHRAPMSETQAVYHMPPLLVFYALEYFVIKAHLPMWAPWIAVASLTAVGALYGLSRRLFGKEAPGGKFLLLSYAALVLLHVGYLEHATSPWAPWGAALLLVLAALSRRAWARLGLGIWPVGAVIGIIFVGNLLSVFFGVGARGVPGRELVGLVYAALLYGGYAMIRSEEESVGLAEVLLYTAHACALAWAVHLLHDLILQSVLWGLLALASLGVALRRRDQTLARSALVLFAATAAKVVLYDLQGSAPIARVVSLLVLGVTFYVGGMVYRRMRAERRVSG